MLPGQPWKAGQVQYENYILEVATLQRWRTQGGSSVLLLCVRAWTHEV